MMELFFIILSFIGLSMLIFLLAATIDVILDLFRGK
jgi:hypothetical protein